MIIYFFTGIACIILAIVIYVIDLINPLATAAFFNIDILASFEDTVIVKTKGDADEGIEKNTTNSDSQEMISVGSTSNGDQNDEEHENVEVKLTTQTTIIFIFTKFFFRIN